MRGKMIGGLQAFAEPRAEREQRDGVAFTQDAAAADLERLALGRHLDAETLAARITERARTVVDRGRGRDHMHELGLVAGRHDDEVRQAAEIGDVERAGMRRAVGADEAGAIDRKPHRQILDRDVMHDLVVGALQEGGVDRRERLAAFGGKAGCERHRMLFGDADIEGAIRKRLAENIEAGARRHRRRDGDDALVLRRFLHQAFAEHLGVGRRIRSSTSTCAPVATLNGTTP